MSAHPTKLAASDRRQAILLAATPMFARLGRAGTTTKDIARAAGVSEALLYKHFPTKDALYAELERHCVEATAIGVSLLRDAEPGTATLVLGVSLLVRAVFLGIGDPAAHENTKRLLTASLLDDGRFARAFLDHHVRPWIGRFADSLRAASRAGEVVHGVETDEVELWFVHHLANTLHLVSLPGLAVVEYGLDREALAIRTTRFLLRGLGLTPTALAREASPDRLRTLLAPEERP